MMTGESLFFRQYRPGGRFCMGDHFTSLHVFLWGSLYFVTPVTKKSDPHRKTTPLVNIRTTNNNFGLQGPTELAVEAGGVFWILLLFLIIYLFFLRPSGRWFVID